MCRDAQSLADFTAHGGGVKASVTANPSSPIAKRFATNCQQAQSPVQVITTRKNTSIVTFMWQTWYVPNVDYFVPPANCLQDGAHVTFSGQVENAFAVIDVYRYPRLKLDSPVCYLGSEGEPAGRYVSLIGTGSLNSNPYNRFIGRHVTVSGKITSPEFGYQPPENMMIVNPKVKTP